MAVGVEAQREGGALATPAADGARRCRNSGDAFGEAFDLAADFGFLALGEDLVGFAIQFARLGLDLPIGFGRTSASTGSMEVLVPPRARSSGLHVGGPAAGSSSG